MGGVVCRGDCGVCGWKDRRRDGNLRTYCRVSPIFVFLFFCGSHPYMFLHFCEMLFLELVSGDIFPGKGAFMGFYNTYMFFQCFSCNLFVVFGGVKRYHLMWFCEVEIAYRES